MADSFFKKMGDINVYLTDSGKFTAQIGDKWVTRASVSALEKEISRLAAPTKAIKAWAYSVGYDIVNVIRKHKNMNFIDDKGKQHSYSEMWEYDERAVRELDEISEELKNLRARQIEIVSSLRRLNLG